jgi:hypothetical protein
MTFANVISLLTLLVLSVSLLALALQVRVQNRVLRAQLLRDRFEMYWKTYEPVTDNHVRDFVKYPEAYMTKTLYEKHYAGRSDDIREYITMAMFYEYLAFTHCLRAMHITDPLGAQWADNWATVLSRSAVFWDVHSQFSS